MKKIILLVSILISVFSFGQETVKTNPKLELKIRENNRVTEVSRVSNKKVVERKSVSGGERRENHKINLKKEKHIRPHFDKYNKNQKENHKKEHVKKEYIKKEQIKKEHHPKERHPKEINRERLNEKRNDRMEKHKIR